MYDPVVILRLYSSVLHKHKREYDVNEADIRTAIQNMKEVYKPNPGSLANPTVSVADYNDAAHRCAYLHKYAPFHTALVADMLGRALQQDLNAFQDLIYASGPMNICSLGGGPGSDIFGVLSVLNATFGFFPVSATVIDCMENWRDLFYELINELRYGNYGALGECVGGQYFDWKYLQHNLLAKMTNQVNTAIARANLVTMIKFVSASSCKDTSAMIKKIFRTMRPGSLVLYIDNAGGGFHQLVRKEARDCNLITVFGPLKHELYVNHNFNTKRFGYTPCLETKVTVEIWRKTHRNINIHLELNEPSSFTVENINAQAEKPARENSRLIYKFSSPESINNQRGPYNKPYVNSQSIYIHQQRVISSQPSDHPEAQALISSHNINTRRTGSHANEVIQSQPLRITSTMSESGRNENDDCCTCCVIS
ncbi:uncharacterized protein LOC129971113 isoform X2 [Argiope bruennichi]|uniref:uncharacterized protein LOC129971113 isoform X2 n=1 Tax=Argiope bruennichi TaxID=94029 RepID=UPI00249531E6|nr:uncharacterized protein LOC129971113 isoform X2 [Argiope bruennichi]